uniref:Uncharacterized protein n=1 Tax=Kalanchoe fedtschenkoi TaxID=63787 RepID=A0A7N0U2M7_KALFE
MPRSRDELPAVRVYTVCDESNLSDTKEKLEVRRKEVISRLDTGKSSKLEGHNENASINHGHKLEPLGYQISVKNPPIDRVSSDQDYFPSDSMNQTVKFVREKLSKIQSNSEGVPEAKKPRLDNRRRI